MRTEIWQSDKSQSEVLQQRLFIAFLDLTKISSDIMHGQMTSKLEGMYLTEICHSAQSHVGNGQMTPKLEGMYRVAQSGDANSLRSVCQPGRLKQTSHSRPSHSRQELEDYSLTS